MDGQDHCVLTTFSRYPCMEVQMSLRRSVLYSQSWTQLLSLSICPWSPIPYFPWCGHLHKFLYPCTCGTVKVLWDSSVWSNMLQSRIEPGWNKENMLRIRRQQWMCGEYQSWLPFLGRTPRFSLRSSEWVAPAHNGWLQYQGSFPGALSPMYLPSARLSTSIPISLSGLSPVLKIFLSIQWKNYDYLICT